MSMLYLTMICGAIAFQEPADTGAVAIGQTLRVVSVRDVDGVEHPLRTLMGQKGAVLVFVSIECPMSNEYLGTLNELAGHFGPKGISTILVAPNETERPADIAAYAKAHGLIPPVFRDTDQAMVRLLGAEVTPEAALIDDEYVLRYRGRIDDRYAARLKRRGQPGREDLREAINDLLAGQAIRTSSTLPLGCPIVKRVVRRPASGGTATFNRDISSILQQHCQDCHRPGQAAPFALLHYDQAVKWADEIQRVTAQRIMPPWKPLPGHGKFRNERRLSASEIAAIGDWAQAGLPEGNPGDRPVPREFPNDDWQLGTPDVVLTMPEEFDVPATGPDIYRQFAIPTHMTDDRWLMATEFRPGNRRVVHHATFFLDFTARSRQLDAADPKPGFGQLGFKPTGSIGAWAMGSQPFALPDGVGMQLPKGADLVLQIHYHPSGRSEKDRSRLGLYFATKPVQQQFSVFSIAGFRIAWPANDPRIQVTGESVVPFDIDLISVLPHMHFLGREFRLTAILPDGRTRPLIYIDDWEFNWNENYVYGDPIRLPRGTRLRLESLYDNSSANPFNPNSPPAKVYLGEHLTDEMCVAYLGITTAPHPK
jgi:hypothetical protein